MRKIFIDSCIFIAMLNPNDQWNEKVSEKMSDIEQHGFKVITSEYVIMEILNMFCKYGDTIKSNALELINDLYSDPNIEIRRLSSDGFSKAIEKFKKYKDKNWSIIDCTSFNIMDEIKTIECLSTDKHFKQAGFTNLLVL
jgi:predicted nucleic acid-binding protein